MRPKKSKVMDLTLKKKGEYRALTSTPSKFNDKVSLTTDASCAAELWSTSHNAKDKVLARVLQEQYAKFTRIPSDPHYLCAFGCDGGLHG